MLSINNSMKKEKYKLMMVDQNKHLNKFQTHGDNAVEEAKNIRIRQTKSHLWPSYTALSPYPNLAPSPQQKLQNVTAYPHGMELRINNVKSIYV